MAIPEGNASPDLPPSTHSRLWGGKKLPRRGAIWLAAASLFLILMIWVVWLVVKGISIRDDMAAAMKLVPELKQELTRDDSDAARQTASLIHSHTNEARTSADDPIWTLTSGLPLVGDNLSAVSEMARSADDVAGLGLVPLVEAWGSLNWDTLMPTGSGSDLESLKAMSPQVASAAYTVRVSAERLVAIDASNLLPQVAEPLASAAGQLSEVTETLDMAADASRIAPNMLGADSPRNYLLMIQNSAEARASGGIPGALAVLKVDKGKLTLSAQTSASSFGVMSPVLPVDPQQQQIYSTRMGKFIQDVNLTPDFPTAAATAQAMWERKTGQLVDGVLSIDPVALSYLLQASGPVRITDPSLAALASRGLPTELNGQNVVKTLLSDVYAKIEQPEVQDAYFAGVAQEVFHKLADGKSDTKQLMSGITRATSEGRIRIWSGTQSEQALIWKYPLSGAVAGPSVTPAQFGVYFNDGTGAKMDYYVQRTVKLIKQCPVGGYEQTRVRVTSTNTAPTDAATSLPDYVTGGGVFGIKRGSVQTNVTVYGPMQSNVESATVEGQKTPFAPHIHANRPLGVIAVQLAPGESKTVEFSFDKIVQHIEPDIVVTPTVQPVNDVVLPTETLPCQVEQ